MHAKKIRCIAACDLHGKFIPIIIPAYRFPDYSNIGMNLFKFPQYEARISTFPEEDPCCPAAITNGESTTKAIKRQKIFFISFPPK